MAVDSVSDFVASLCDVRLLETEQQNALARDLLPRFPEPRTLAGELIRRGWLTPYQANLLLQGRGGELTLGSYVLLERIGEGGMGQVFKARNWKLGRIVALKLIRKERLASEDAVRRFYREIRAAAVLSHPNIVAAYDADEVNGTHFFAMEYVEGTDLAKLIKQHGPLPVAQACDWVRQAALGLQHAHERGLVHRDIKPHNLLLTRQGAVKILDMGLARIGPAGEDDEASTTMTQEGAVMGTPDYMAPEQAEESHTVDIRADLYSLGCTLYQLLTGKVPFPGGTLIQKLKKHQSDQPSPVEKARPDVPPAVADIVYRLMAKRPEDRYQTPVELVRALETLPAGPRTEARVSSLEPTVNEALDFRPSDATVQGMQDVQRSRRRTEKRRLLLAASAGGVLLLGLAVALWLFNRRANHPLPPTQPVVVEQPKAREEDKRPFDEWLREVAALPAEKQVEAVIAELKHRNPGFDGKEKHEIKGGVVTLLSVRSNELVDVSPVRALPGLKDLSIWGVHPGRGKFADLTQLTGMPLLSLGFPYTSVRDLSPLKGMPLVQLGCTGTDITDLSPLQGMPLVTLYCGGLKVSDLSPLKGMPLRRLDCDASPVSDLSVMKGMPLSYLVCTRTHVSDLSVLKGMPLTTLRCERSRVTDLSPLRGLPLKELSCDFNPYRDAEILRSIKTLETINGKPAAEFWKEVEAQQTAFDAWCKQVAAMPPEEQVEAVADELKKRNPGFDGKVTRKIEGGKVTLMEVRSNEVADVSPVRALPGLKTLTITGIPPGKAKFADLRQLKGMSLRALSFPYTSVRDLSPLREMPLVSLSCGGSDITDLSPLRGMRFTELNFPHTSVTDLSPLQGMPLVSLFCGRTGITDLSPLRGMRLIRLYCNDTKVADLSPLKDMPLARLNCYGTPVADLSVVRGMPLTQLDCRRTQISELSVLKGMSLLSLLCDGSPITDLSPLQGVPLQEVSLNFRPERDAAILRSIKTLETINGKPAAEFWKNVSDPPKP